jgi:4-diphosphocytidyl-2-C-methyl-D-erythritol kinase
MSPGPLLVEALPANQATWDSAYPAPAKLNLFLHVTGRRADGYHLLQTAFHFVGHGDELRFAPREDGEVRLARPLPGVPEESDLTVRAARLLKSETGCARGVTIAIEKRLPMGGGLGGGSSDAATVLLALNHLWGLGLSRRRLQEIGLALGADVPVFVFGDNAFAQGIGEELEAVAMPESWYLVLVPPVSVPTPDIFRSPDLRRDTPPLDRALWKPGDGHNDLQPVAVAKAPVIGEYLDWLGRFGDARMTGSGSCVFASFVDREAASRAFAERPPGMAGWLAPGLAAHPLRGLAA